MSARASSFLHLEATIGAFAGSALHSKMSDFSDVVYLSNVELGGNG